MLFSNQKVSVVRFALILALLGGVLGVIPVMADTERTKSSKDIEQSYITQTDTNPVFTQVSTGSGSRYTCALTADGNVKCWGRNDTGQLGDGTATQRTAPVDVLVAPGGAPLTGVSAIATGFDHACALMTSGQVKCWGVNYWGQLGDGTLNAHTTPVDVLSIPGGLPLSGVIAITSSSHHTCALMSTGGVKCWGLNMRGQLGNSTTNNATTPVNVLLVPGSGTPLLGVSAVTAGGDHTCALTTSAGIKCWGYNFDGQLGDNTTTQRANPIDVIGLSSGVIAVSAGYNHTCAVTTGGEVKCWGNNNNGQLGDGTTTQRHTPVSVLTTPGGPGLSGISNVSAGGFVTCALTTIAGAKCWGGNAGGNLGDGTLFMRNTAVDVLEAPAGAPLSDVSKVITYGHSCALTTSGGVKCWGYNNYGQLGDGTNISRYNPVDLTFKTPQTISINTPAPTSAKYGTSFTVAAVTSSGLAVTYSASGACTNVGATFTMTSGSTTCTVNYEQAGDADYTFAPPLTSTVTAQRVPITVTADAKNRIYGEPDPVLTYQITSGTLVGTDTFTGALSRVAGSNVGTYAISKNTLALNSSKYILTYVGASLTINKRPITVTADAKTKTAGMPDPALTYQMTSGTLVTPDILTGSLSRDPGEAVGAYSIRQGTLSLSSNYDLTYTGANLTIVSNGSTVTNTNDSGIGSLRQTIADAASGDTITFDPSLAGQTITLASDLVINQDLTIDGSGLSPQVTVSGGSVAHLQIPISYHVVTISDLAIVNGHSGGDGGAILSYGDLTIRNSTLRDNHSAGSGGAIATSGMLTLENSTIEHNQADGLGGGISISAISASCCTITNSTLAQNQAGAGGAISFVGNGNSTITNTTFFQNQAVESGGAFYMSGNVVVDVSNSTIAGNNAPQGSELFTLGNGWISLYNSIIICKPENSSCIVQPGAFAIGNSDSIIGVGTPSDFGLAEPADNGGSTKTMALLPDSPLIDAGDDANCPATDQRGVTRPQGVHCDMGAFESDGPFVPTPTHTPTSTPTGTSTPTPTHTPTNTPTNTPTSTPPYSYNPLLLSLTGNQTISGISSSDEDILRFDGSTWSLLFDGSDVGVGSSDLFGFSVVDPDSLLMSFSSAVTVNGLAITPQDVVRFDATSLGTTTAGTFSMYLDGSDVGLDTTAEKIDSVSLLPDGRVLISTTGNPAVSGMTGGKDEDVLAFTPTSLGDVTSGSWAMYFDGSDVGLAETSGEDVDALDVVGGKVYLSTADTFSVNGVSGADEDVFVCVPTSLGDVTACNYSSALYFDGSTWGLSANDVDAFNSLTLGPVPTPTATSTPTSTPTATKTPTPGSQLLPDLTIIEMRNELQNTSCFTPGDPFGVRVWVRNNGQAAAGSFVVNVNGAEQTLNGLAVGETKAVFFPGSGNPVTATVDSTSVVAESDETNNTRSEMLPIPTAPLPCATPTFTPTPAATFTPTITYTPDASDLIFADGFESGNLSAWSSSSTDLGDLSVSTAAALAPAGSQGLQLVINDNNSMYLTDDSPMAEQRYRARFYFDPNSISMASNDVHFIFRGFTGTSTDVLRLEFRNSSGVYQLRAALLNDSSAWTNTNWFTVSDAPHFIELDWRAAIAAGANNGGLTLWIDGVQQADLTGVDNDALRIDRIRLGALTGIDIGTRGAYYFDAFESRRQSYIGP